MHETLWVFRCVTQLLIFTIRYHFYSYIITVIVNNTTVISSILKYKLSVYMYS